MSGTNLLRCRLSDDAKNRRFVYLNGSRQPTAICQIYLRVWKLSGGHMTQTNACMVVYKYLYSICYTIPITISLDAPRMFIRCSLSDKLLAPNHIEFLKLLKLLQTWQTSCCFPRTTKLQRLHKVVKDEHEVRRRKARECVGKRSMTCRKILKPFQAQTYICPAHATSYVASWVCMPRQRSTLYGSVPHLIKHHPPPD